MRLSRKGIIFIPLFLLSFHMQTAKALIAPVRETSENCVQLFNCEEIKMEFELLDFYHHPLGIWMVSYQATLRNIRSNSLIRKVGFPAGYDARIIEGELICDYFENFEVRIEDKKVDNINYLVKCADYSDATGSDWTLDDGSGTGFLNTWQLTFDPGEVKNIYVTFSFVVTKPPIIYDPDNEKSWYLDTMEWIKRDYATKAQNQFKIPINLGSFWAFYPDSIVIRSFFSDEWLKIIKPAERTYKNNNIVKYEFSEPFGFYSPPEVYLSAPTDQELKNMSRTELVLLKNSFAAKYGRPFENSALNLFFKNQSWYSVNPDFNSWYLTDWDVRNVKYIDQFINEYR